MQTTKPNYAYGIYEVGNRIFLNKSEALYHATQTKQTVTWDFHNDTYGAYDWSIRPSGTLRDIYRQRAQQIRDTYDYVVIYFGGGADSWTALHSFLSNGIHVDEIYSRWAFTEEKYKPVNNVDRRQFNLHSEYEYATLPVLKDIEKRFPKTKITIDDYSNDYIDDVDEQLLSKGGHYTTLGTFHRFCKKSDLEQQAVKQGKSVGVVHGFDKILYCLEDNQMYAYFVDRFAGTDLDPDRSIEGFFWTKNMPEIPIMQAHEVKQYYQLHPELNLNEFKRKIYCSICYPDWNVDTFQVGKPLGSEIWASEAWVYEFNPRYVQSWKWALNQYMDKIDTEFCEYYQDSKKFRTGYKPMKSPLYRIGTFVTVDN